MFRGVILEKRVVNGEVVYQVRYRAYNNDVVRWVDSSRLTVDNIGDSLERTHGRPIVYADTLSGMNLPPGNDSSYRVHKCLICNLYYGDINRHVYVYHGMFGQSVFNTGIEYTSTPRGPRRDMQFFRHNSTLFPIRRGRFFD